MSKNEQMLIAIMKSTKDKNMQAIILQSYIAENDPVSDETGDIIKKFLGEDN